MMVEQFGGLEGLLHAWVDYHNDVMKKGGYSAFRAFNGVLNLLKFRAEHLPEPPPVSMTD